MLNAFRKSDAHREALRRIKAWTRERFRLPEDTAVLVTEIACAVPGCPPLETVVAFWTEGEQRRHFKVFKPAAEVTEEDLPPSWMRDRLVEAEVFGCPCC
jgi:nitrate reductase delta subunit